MYIAVDEIPPVGRVFRPPSDRVPPFLQAGGVVLPTGQKSKNPPRVEAEPFGLTHRRLGKSPLASITRCDTL